MPVTLEQPDLTSAVLPTEEAIGHVRQPKQAANQRRYGQIVRLVFRETADTPAAEARVARASQMGTDHPVVGMHRVRQSNPDK